MAVLSDKDRSYLWSIGHNPDDYETIDLEKDYEPVKDHSEIPEHIKDNNTNKSNIVSDIWEKANTPLVNNVIPRVSGEEVSQTLFGQQQPGLGSKVIAGALRGGASLAEGLTSPLGLAASALPAAKLLPFIANSAKALRGVDIAGKVAAGGFAGQAAYQTPQAVMQAKEQFQQGDIEGGVESSIGALGSVAIAGLAGKHAMQPLVKVPNYYTGQEQGPRIPMQLPLESESTVKQRSLVNEEQQRRFLNQAENINQGNIPYAEIIDQQLKAKDPNLGLEYPSNEALRPAKENYLVQLENERAKGLTPEHELEALTQQELVNKRDVAKRPAQAEIPIITEEDLNSGRMIPELEGKTTGEIDSRLPQIYKDQFQGQELPQRTSESVTTKDVRTKLVKEQGFTVEEVNKMSPETANTIYNNKVEAPFTGNENPKLRSSEDLALKDKTSKGLNIKYGSSERGSVGNITPGHQTNLDLPPEKLKVDLGPFASQIDVRLRKLGNTGNYLADRFMDFHHKQREYLGMFENELAQIFKDNYQSKYSLTGLGERAFSKIKDSSQLHKYMIDMSENGMSDIKLSPNLQRVANGMHRLLGLSRTIQNKIGIPVDGREGLHKKFYYPQTVKSAVLNELTQKPESVYSKQLKRDFVRYQTEKTGNEGLANKRLKEFLDSLQSGEETNRASQFGPVDKAEGFGIPESWRESNPLTNLDRYFRRIARRFAYHEALHSDSLTREILGIDKDIHGEATPQGQLLPGSNEPVSKMKSNDIVAPILENIEGKVSGGEIKLDAAASLYKSAILGPLTGVKNLISSQFGGLQHQLLSQTLPAKFSSIKNVVEGINESTKVGVNRHNVGSIVTNENGKFDPVNILHEIRDVSNRVQGSNIIERLQRGLNFSEGQFLAMDNLWRLHKGQRAYQTLKFFKDFAPDNKWKSFIERGEMPAEYMNQMAARYVNAVQGTYTLENLPRVAYSGPIGSALNLARWNVEKANNFVKYVVNPALNGHPYPLMMATLGAAIGGTALTKIVETITRRKDIAANEKELLEAKKTNKEGFSKELAYKLMSLASISAYGGILSDVSKNLMDASKGNFNRGYNNPLMQAVGDNTTLLAQAIGALVDGEPKMDLFVKYASEFLERNFQVIRLGMQRFGPETKEDIANRNDVRDLKVFNRLEGETSEAAKVEGNPFTNIREKEFKKTTDPKKAEKLAGELINKMFSEYGNKPETLVKKFEALKNIPINGMPNVEKEPLTLENYVAFLRNTQGPERVDQLLGKFEEQLKAKLYKQALLGVEN